MYPQSSNHIQGFGSAGYPDVSKYLPSFAQSPLLQTFGEYPNLNNPSFTPHNFNSQYRIAATSDDPGLQKYFGAASNYLSPSGLLLSKDGVSHAPPQGPTPLPTGTFKRLLIGPDGQRLPSVVKKPLPMPPEDVRAIPHMRASPRPESPPVVSIGMTDNDGIPVPWRKTPELLHTIGTTSKDLPGPRRSSPSLDEVKQAVRDDFDALEAFIEGAFTSLKSN